MTEASTSLAIVFADLGDSTRLYDTLGDERAHALASGVVGRLIEVVEKHGGHVVKTIGDEVMSTFPSADRAVVATQAMQRAAADASRRASVPLGVHIGIHYGPVIEETHDVFGDAVNVAARMRSLARAGQILTTSQTVEGLGAEHRKETRRVDRRSLAGKREVVEIHEVIWQRANLTAIDFAAIAEPEPGSRPELVLEAGGVPHPVAPGRPVRIGRDPANEFVFDDPRVSRFHAEVALRDGKYVLRDQSTNGTAVLCEGTPTVFLRREEHILPASGTILVAPGQAEQGPEIRFTLRTA